MFEGCLIVIDNMVASMASQKVALFHHSNANANANEMVFPMNMKTCILAVQRHASDNLSNTSS
jgi:hypothetical protein